MECKSYIKFRSMASSVYILSGTIKLTLYPKI